MPDFIDSNNAAFAANLLRRLSDRIVDEVDIWLRTQGFGAPARTASTMMMLSERGPATITEIAAGIGFSHPFVIRLVGQLEELGYVRSTRDAQDARRRIVELTDQGRSEALRMVATRALVGRAIETLLVETEVDLLADLRTLGAALDRHSMTQRLENIQGEGE